MSTAEQTTVAEIVTASPNTSEVFERFGIDYCCGGEQSLQQACSDRDVDIEDVRRALEAAVDEPASEGDLTSLLTAPLGELCERIVTRYHGPLRVAGTRVAKLTETVARVHGPEHPELVTVNELYVALCAEVEEHLQVEETEVFPACAALDGQSGSLSPEIVEQLRDDHRSVGSTLAEIRELLDGYDERHANCRTHQQMLIALKSYETEMHKHVHEENYILFPRALEVAGVA